jgi:ADP-ribose pyrophosphatase
MDHDWNKLPNPNDPATPPVLGALPTDRLIHAAKRATLVLRSIPTHSGIPLAREVVVHPGAVIILPILADGRIVLIRNRRHTVHQELLELPAGTLEKKPDGTPEDPARCAARELVEETGYSARNLAPFGWFYTSPGILTEKMYAFIATDLAPGAQHLEDNEQIRVELLDESTVLRLIRENRIVDAKTIATVLKYFAMRP